MKKILILIIAVLAVACSPSSKQKTEKTKNKPMITVTIEPLRYFTEALANDRFEVVSMVPKGSSPETYDPTPQQLANLSQSKAYFRIGHIGFEQTWIDRLTDNAPHLQFFDTSHGIDLIYDTHESDEHDHHHGGVEPHIWNSTTNAVIIAGNIAKALCAIDKEYENVYMERYAELCQRIERIDSLIRLQLKSPKADKAFLIYHPALSYFARDYELTQISIEDNGKEPSLTHLKQLMHICRQERIRIIFVQPEFDQRNAQLIAQQIGAEIITLNPLAYDWEAEMLHTAKALIKKD